MDQFSNDPLRDATGDDGAQDRNAARDSLFLMAELRTGVAAATTVRVRNLSAGGMMAEFPQGMDEGAAVECELRGVGPVRGRVAWSAAGRIGIAFDRQIDPMLARKPVGTGAKPKVVTPFAPRR